jgi:hypothetical protein
MTHLDARITISHASPITLDSFAFVVPPITATFHSKVGIFTPLRLNQ